MLLCVICAVATFVCIVQLKVQSTTRFRPTTNSPSSCPSTVYNWTLSVWNLNNLAMPYSALDAVQFTFRAVEIYVSRLLRGQSKYLSIQNPYSLISQHVSWSGTPLHQPQLLWSRHDLKWPACTQFLLILNLHTSQTYHPCTAPGLSTPLWRNAP